jgi:hypothetical protein
MSETGILKLTVAKEPWRSKVEVDGKQVMNVKGFKVEQVDCRTMASVEVSLIGSEFAVEAPVEDVWVRGFCPNCQTELASREQRYDDADREFAAWFEREYVNESVAWRAENSTTLKFAWWAARGL